MAQHTFRVEGLHCQGCVNTVTAVLGGMASVTDVEIDLDTSGPSAMRIDSDHTVSVEQLQTALREVGNFSVRPA